MELTPSCPSSYAHKPLGTCACRLPLQPCDSTSFGDKYLRIITSHFVLLWKGVSRIPLDVAWNKLFAQQTSALQCVVSDTVMAELYDKFPSEPHETEQIEALGKDGDTNVHRRVVAKHAIGE